MNFLTEGKVNWQYLLVILILAILVGGGILGYQYWWILKQEVEKPEIKIPEVVVEDQTIDWETYYSPTMGFFIKYPPD